MHQQIVSIATRELAPAALAIAAFGALGLAQLPVLGLILTCAALLLLWFTNRPPTLGSATSVRVLLTAGVMGYAVRASGHLDTVLVAGALLLGSLLLEALLGRIAAPWSVVVRLPRPWPRTTGFVQSGGVWLLNSGLVAAVGVLVTLSGPPWLVLTLPAAGAVVCGTLFIDGWRRWRSGHRAELAALRRAVDAHRPTFFLYFSAPPGSEYQARMWLPYLEQIGEPFLVVLAEQDNLAAVSSATDAPVVVYRSFAALDAVMVDSVRVVFYVNNGMANTHCVRYAHLTHVQLYHGDSDKAVGANPVNAMYDQVFVAGRAAIDRFAKHGVSIPPEKFRIVGRPRVADLEVANRSISEVADKTVLYAPTWRGAYGDSNTSSIPIAEPIITALLDRGVTVILRVHPYARKDRASAAQLRHVERLLAADRAHTGRPHLWGAAASTQLSLQDCMNRSHSLIADVSSVASEYLFCDKPLAVTDMLGSGADLASVTPLAAAAYVIDSDAGNVRQVLEDLLERDPLASERRQMRAYYHGDFAPGEHAGAFLRQAKACVSHAKMIKESPTKVSIT